MCRGVWVVDKPAGITSLDVIRQMKRWMGPVRMGHTGTLDPLATGVLPICVGEATRLLNYMELEPKRYRGRLRLGLETDTWDITGKVVARSAVPDLPLDALKAVFDEQRGLRFLTAPVFSAIKFKGRPLYAYAREGRPIQPPQREVSITSCRVLRREGLEVVFDLVCGRGTYVRSVVHAVGRSLGCGACLLELRRLQCGRFHVEDAWTLEDVKQACERGRMNDVLLPPEAVLDHYEGVHASGEMEQRVRHGNPLRRRDLSRFELNRERLGEKARILADNRLVAVAEIREDAEGFYLQPLRVLTDGKESIR